MSGCAYTERGLLGGSTLEFMLSDTRDASAAKRFFKKLLKIYPTSAPRVINVERNPSYPRAFQEWKTHGMMGRSCDLRRIKNLNNIIKQDHRFIKRRVNLGLGFYSFERTWRTIQGCETIRMIKQRAGGSQRERIAGAAYRRTFRSRNLKPTT